MEKTTSITFRIDPELEQLIDLYQKQMPGVPRSVIIRDLLKESLDRKTDVQTRKIRLKINK
tara:strand:+ start:414 stop:596 length:183 start_codon:yes stop_codon:yes gene_type:complete